jgi:hypothetical protein
MFDREIYLRRRKDSGWVRDLSAGQRRPMFRDNTYPSGRTFSISSGSTARPGGVIDLDEETECVLATIHRGDRWTGLPFADRCEQVGVARRHRRGWSNPEKRCGKSDPCPAPDRRNTVDAERHVRQSLPF